MVNDDDGGDDYTEVKITVARCGVVTVVRNVSSLFGWGGHRPHTYFCGVEQWTELDQEIGCADVCRLLLSNQHGDCLFDPPTRRTVRAPDATTLHTIVKAVAA